MTQDSSDGETGLGGFTFNRTVSLGNVLVILTMLAGVISLYVAQKEVMVNHELRIKYLELQSQSRINTIQEMTMTMFNIQRDVAVIKDRLERKDMLK